MFAIQNQKFRIMRKFNDIIRIGSYAVLASVIAMSSTSCNTDDKDENNGTGGNPTPTVYEGDGALIAIKSMTTISQPIIGDIEMELGLAVAVFANNGDYNNLLPAGTVKCAGENLTIQQNNSYVFTPGATNPTGLELGNSPSWEVTGQGAVPAINHTASNGFPAVGSITSGGTVNRSQGYTVTVQGNITNADSVIWNIGGVVVTTPRVNSYTFTADQLSGLPTGTSIVQAAPVNYQTASFGGKTFYFINERVSSKTVTVE